MTKRANFIRLAESRTNIIVKTIKLLSNLSNKSVYDYSEKDIKEIFSVIEKELKLARIKFDAKINTKFKLSSK